jgi:uncharacterized protein (TIGR03083 family)
MKKAVARLETYLELIRRESDALLAAAGDQLAVDVPSCPGWTMERLVGHVGRVYRWTAGWVLSGESTEVDRAPKGEAVLAWTETGRDQVLRTLQEVDLSGRTATWAGEQPAMFWPRRMAVETALHRWDAENAAGGDAQPVDAALAVDAVDELLAVLLPQRKGDSIQALGATGSSLHLHATDVTGEWLVTFTGPPEHLQVEREHAKGDVAARGTASDLLLVLNNRVPLDRLDVFGDRGLLERWADHVRI